jgi:hypothetical protein
MHVGAKEPFTVFQAWQHCSPWNAASLHLNISCSERMHDWQDKCCPYHLGTQSGYLQQVRDSTSFAV